MLVFLVKVVVFGCTAALMTSDTYKKTAEIEGEITLNLTSLTDIECGSK